LLVARLLRCILLPAPTQPLAYPQMEQEGT
jgi:hypothetical protein